MWLLPLLCGVAGYALRASDAGSVVHPLQTEARPEEFGSLEEARDALEAVPARFEEQETRRLQIQESFTSQEIRQRLRTLAEQRAAGPFGDGRAMQLQSEERALLARLAHCDGVAGAIWIRENLPEARHLFMDGWANDNPAAALDFVVHSDSPRPCAMSTLMKLLDGQAKEGAEVLRTMIDSVPWHLFDHSCQLDAESPEFMMSSCCGVEDHRAFEFSPGSQETNRVWLESGAARAIAERGIPVAGVLGSWFKLDPSRALIEWSTWPRYAYGGESSAYDLEEIMEEGASDPEEIEVLRNSFKRADPATAAKIRQTLGDLLEESPADSEARQFTGEDFSPLPESGAE